MTDLPYDHRAEHALVPTPAPVGKRLPWLAVQFDTPKQQFSAGNLGMWLFLAAEVLFFSGLFCAYLIFRQVRPEAFVWGHYFLDVEFGALNTWLLIASSLTAALAVRSAQLGQRRHLLLNITLTLVLAGTFLGVKCVEYSAKYRAGLLPGARFNPTEHVWERAAFERRYPEAAAYAARLRSESTSSGQASVLAGTAAGAGVSVLSTMPTEERVLRPLLEAGVIGPASEYSNFPSMPRNVHQFFGIYFFMTGLHAVHVIAGMLAWLWLLARATTGVFGPGYFGPIYNTALYWHLVDLIWIFLFPLLYLIQ